MSLGILSYGQKVCDWKSYAFLTDMLNAIIVNNFSNLF